MYAHLPSWAGCVDGAGLPIEHPPVPQDMSIFMFDMPMPQQEPPALGRVDGDAA